jgi:hypothetical protein
MQAKGWRKRQIMTHIEPCPFCGHVGLDFSEGSTYRWGEACCSGCGATCGEVRREYPDKGEWHQEAIRQWNTRAKRHEWVGLTDEDLANCDTEEYKTARYWEAKLCEKNSL